MNWNCRKAPKGLKTHVLERDDTDGWWCAHCDMGWSEAVLEKKGQVLSLADFGRQLVEEGGSIL